MSFMAPTKQGNHLLNLIHYSYNYLLMEYNQLCVVTPHGQQCQYSAHSNTGVETKRRASENEG